MKSDLYNIDNIINQVDLRDINNQALKTDTSFEMNPYSLSIGINSMSETMNHKGKK